MYEDSFKTLVIRATRFDITGRGLRDFIYWMHFTDFGLGQLCDLSSAMTTACLFACRYPTVQKINVDYIVKDRIGHITYRENFDVVKDCWKMRNSIECPVSNYVSSRGEYDVRPLAIRKLCKRITNKFNLI